MRYASWRSFTCHIPSSATCRPGDPFSGTRVIVRDHGRVDDHGRSGGRSRGLRTVITLRMMITDNRAGGAAAGAGGGATGSRGGRRGGWGEGSREGGFLLSGSATLALRSGGEDVAMAERLRDATSPYLRQHADNPVDWW